MEMEKKISIDPKKIVTIINYIVNLTTMLYKQD